MSPVSHADTLNSETFGLGPPVFAVVGGIVAGGLGGLAVAGAAGWGASGSGAGSVFSAALLAAIVWTLAALPGLACLLVVSKGSIDRLGPAVLGSSAVRLHMGLALGVVAYFALQPDGRTFWSVFLASGVAALIAEAAWTIKLLNPAPRVLPAALAIKVGAR